MNTPEFRVLLIEDNASTAFASIGTKKNIDSSIKAMPELLPFLPQVLQKNKTG